MRGKRPTSTLRQRVIDALSAPPVSPVPLPICVPKAIEYDVLDWGRTNSTHHLLMDVRDDVIIACSIKAPTTGGPLPALDEALRREAAHFLKTIERELNDLSKDNPIRRYDTPAMASLPFRAYAVMHPNLARFRPLGDDELFADRTYVVFPCHPCEVPDDPDLAWAKVQVAHVERSELSRAPRPAYKFARGGRGRSKVPKRKPGPPKPSTIKGLTSALAAEAPLEVENWRGEVIALHNAAVVLLPDGAPRAIAGMNDARAVVRAFLETGDLLPGPGDADPLIAGDLGRQFEAMGQDPDGEVDRAEVRERVTMQTVVTLRVELIGPRLRVEYEDLDPRVTEDHLRELVNDPYLRVFTNHHWQGKAKEVCLCSPEGAQVVYPYPDTKAPVR